MNPPFSASPNIARAMRDATARHIRSALRRLPEGGRLVALTHSSHDPADSAIAALYREPGFEPGFAFTATVDGRIYARHGTSVDTRLTVIDRMPRPEPLVSAGHARTLAELLGFIESGLPQRAAGDRHFRAPCQRVIRRHCARRPREVPAPCLGSAAGSPPSRGQAPKQRNWPTRRARPPARRRSSATASTNLTRFRALSSPEPGRIRPSSCNRPPWRRCARPFRPTGRFCRAGW